MKTLKLILVLVAIMALPLLSLCDVPPPPPVGGGGGTPGPVGAPIDGGVSILLAMGIAYGGKKLYIMRKEKDKLEIETEA